jgi:hypothetical protein
VKLPAAVATIMALAAPSAVAADPPRSLWVYGDSFAVGTRPFLPGELRGWRVAQDTVHNRDADDAAPALRRRPGAGPVVHLSLGTISDPKRPDLFRAAVRRAMQAAGRRCVVWPNIWRPARKPLPDWSANNAVLADEASRRDNLVVVDWAGLLWFHRDWLDPWDNTHVDERGYRARARMVAEGARECHRRLRRR